MYSAYGATHYRPIVESGGLELARNWGDLLDRMRVAMTQPARNREARARMVREVCGVVDGNAGSRVVDAITRMVEGIGSPRASAASA